MRHVLVPTDLSSPADNALEYARLLAEEFSARLTLVYIHSLPRDPLRIGEVSSELYQQQEKALHARAERLRDQGLEVDIHIQLGKPIGRLKRLIYRNPFDLVVMGCQGENQVAGRFFGSTTTALMDEVTVPILAVPAGFPPAFPRALMWATDQRPVRNAKTLYPLYELVERATTELRVFHYQESGEKKLPDERFKELLAEVRHDFFYQLADGDTVEGAIREFVQLTGVDLITVIHRQSTWLSRLIVASNTREIIWRSPVPVLILQEVTTLSSVAS
ncbi:nucleotide-binding universal stress UspA family protein [Lewinella marina]|uniref:UspA domain-containing protein n=1 Tax=Neolewinella marina TaxID=438751 RepID=A0A2G0CCJ0_9BACT|nr:universal stress protein [Neolewinella marina]NJB87680.1 nucleotide-binding universal stress UspA family protein [Neolewinella marina]PHK97637.1 hypothetical protein CGL56_14485 [Neolewinella marina]